MKTLAARFLKGIVRPDPLLDDGTPQIAFVGRSNVGKSSLINSLTGIKGLARTSSFPGRTQEINVFAVERQYWLDLPGYGYSKHSLEKKRELHRLIDWYLFKSGCRPKRVVLIIDAVVGPTDNDFEMLRALEATDMPFVVVANKADKIKKGRAEARWRELRAGLESHKLIPYSSQEILGRKELAEELFGLREHR
ncbi:MAG: ribosome biogenesis GTP-binding protein YihA/YsxC [Acidobacteriota bacterium]|nr:ribosome biogenesis GTP-binding protein YihA/YsxC [Acidobacteriota bacterium]